MGAIVFTSGGSRKYHFDKDCSAFQSAQLLSDADCGCDTYCTHRMPRMHGLKRATATGAAMDGKLPCLACVPEHLREMPDTEDFGHWPHTGISLASLADTVCQRCTERGVWFVRGNDEYNPVHIPWPCTSAIVLGLVAREAA